MRARILRKKRRPVFSASAAFLSVSISAVGLNQNSNFNAN